MGNGTETNPDATSMIPGSFSDAIRELFRQWAECKKLHLAYQKQSRGPEGQKKLAALQDTLTDMILFARKIEEKFGQKMNSEDGAAFKDVMMVASKKMAQIIQEKPVQWGDGEEFFSKLLHIANQIEKDPHALSEITGKVRGRIAHNSSDPYII